jgi:hypothetical protein
MMKKSKSAALLPFLSTAFVVMAAGLALVVASSPQAVAGPLAQTSEWTSPLNVSNNRSMYDNTPSIAAIANGAITIGWERRDYNARMNYIMQSSNTSLGGPLNMQEVDFTSPDKASGRPRVRADSQGRRHIVYWQSDNGLICDYYARVEVDGRWSVRHELIPDTCGRELNFPALAIGPDDTVHVLLGKNEVAFYYYRRNTQGVWDRRVELVSDRGRPTDLQIAVSTQGVIMAAWKADSPGGNYDIFTAIRNGDNNWSIENISYACCTGCEGNSRAYGPALAADPTGGFRLAWVDETCNPRYSPRETDPYYREWVPGTGWNNQPLVLVDTAAGEAYNMSIAVDPTGVAHLAWGDDTGRPTHDYQFYYTYGRGTVFAAVTQPFRSWGGSAYLKEPSLAYGGGYLHASFGSNREDTLKENYYSRRLLQVVPTPTPTPRCPGERYTDVCPGDTFYTYIMNLTELGVIGGYSDGTFRPNNPLTRGQISKIIALAAGLPTVQPNQPTFADVPANHTFYPYVEASYAAGVITGYPCGGPGEPCDPQNRPYFRPDNWVTRGQISKMAAIAFGFNEPVSGQTFTDVPPTHTFYQYIERMARRGIIGGYSQPSQCPTGVPCFRPSDNVTRGQACKIVDGARQQAALTPTTTPTSTPVPPSPTNTPVVPTNTPEAATPTATVTMVARPSSGH